MENVAKWIWYPGEREIFLAGKMLLKRDYRLRKELPFWRLDNPYPLVYFYKDVDIGEDENIYVKSNAETQVFIDEIKYIAQAADGGYVLPRGRYSLKIAAVNYASDFIYIMVDGKTVKSDESWLATLDNYRGEKYFVGFSDSFSDKFSPNEVSFEKKKILPEKRRYGSKTVYDFGKEIFGRVSVRPTKYFGKLTVLYGESLSEALSAEHCETYDVLNVSAGSECVSDKSRGFRYVGFDTEKVDNAEVFALSENLPIKKRGAFKTDDEIINKIEDVAEYTFKLNSRETFLDGIKRDRWCWAGDAYQSFLFNYYSFFDVEINRRTLWALLGKEPFTHYINHIQDYSYFWFISLYDHYFYTGDISFLRSIFPRAVKALNFCMDQIGDDGFVRGDPYRDWVFIDWVDMPRDGVVSAEQILFCVALKKMAYLAAVLGYKDLSEKFKFGSERLKEAIFKLFYNVEKGFFYNNAVDGKVTGSITVYSNVFAVMYSLVDDTERERIINSAIFAPDVERIKTPYAKLFELIALCEAGKHKEVCDIMRSYWGGMLKNGATSFWEFYDESEHGEDKYAMYDRPYGKSCCHAWGAGPIYINGRYFLGVRPTDVAYKSFSVTPELNDYGCIEGVVPTVNGEISIGMNTRVLKVKSSVDGKGVIYIHKKYNPEIRGELRGNFYSVPINKGEEICVKLNYARNI